MLLLTPLFVYTGWFYPYQFGVCPCPPGGRRSGPQRKSDRVGPKVGPT
jgi:hypothetical protein